MTHLNDTQYSVFQGNYKEDTSDTIRHSLTVKRTVRPTQKLAKRSVVNKYKPKKVNEHR